MGRSRGGLTNKVHTVVDANGAVGQLLWGIDLPPVGSIKIGACRPQSAPSPDLDASERWQGQATTTPTMIIIDIISTTMLRPGQ
jgi:hypothetical protein